MLRHLPGGDTARPIVELLDGLDRVFDWSAGPDPDPSMHRARYVNALLLFAKFLDQVTARDFGHELVHLASALHDLDHGTVHSLLKPAAVDSRPMDGTEVWMARAKIALAIEILLRSGMRKRNLKDILAGRIPMIKPLVTQSDDAGTASLTWHKTFRSEKVKNRVAQSAFQRSLADFQTLSKGASPAVIRVWAAQLLDVSASVFFGD
jgi:hypothetical protein